MDHKLRVLERAFQLANSGQVTRIDDLRKRLKSEGYDASEVYFGPSLKLQLRELIKAAHLETTASAYR
jgi:hypothetical protein